MSTVVAVGVCMAVVGSAAINLGNNLQALGHRKALEQAILQAADKDENECSAANKAKHHPIWIIGTVIFALGSLVNFGAFALAPASILAPIEGVTFVTNVIFGKFVLGAKLTCRLILGTFLIVCGIISAVTSGHQQASTLTIAQMMALWARGAWIGFMISMASVAIVAFLVHKYLERRRLHWTDADEGSRLRRLEQLLSPLSFSLYSTIVGTQQVVEAKCLAELVTFWQRGGAIWEHWFTYMVVIAWLFMAGFWVVQLNSALRLYNPQFIIPMIMSFFITLAVLSGGVFFREFEEFKVVQWIFFWIGISIMLVGLYILGSEPSEESAEPQASNRSAEGGDPEQQVVALERTVTMLDNSLATACPMEFLKVLSDPHHHTMWSHLSEASRMNSKHSLRSGCCSKEMGSDTDVGVFSRSTAASAARDGFKESQVLPGAIVPVEPEGPKALSEANLRMPGSPQSSQRCSNEACCSPILTRDGVVMYEDTEVLAVTKGDTAGKSKDSVNESACREKG